MSSAKQQEEDVVSHNIRHLDLPPPTSDHGEVMLVNKDHKGRTSSSSSSKNKHHHHNHYDNNESTKYCVDEVQFDDRSFENHNGEQVAVLENRYTFWQAVGFNCMNMFGTGPFISYPYAIASVEPPGTQAMIGYGVAVLACFTDSLVWAELGSMWPMSGGSYVYLRELYGPNRWGRFAAFMFIWQFFISGPAELASGFIAMSDYLSYITGTSQYWVRVPLAIAFLVVCYIILYRRIDHVGRMTLFLWFITIFAIAFTLIAGFVNFDPENIKAPEGAFSDPGRFVLSMAAATRFGIYDMTGYYDVCQMGGEVQNPRRTIPRSCISTCLVVGIIYILTYLAIGGVMPYDGEDGFLDRIEAGEGVYIMSEFAEKLLGRSFAIFFTIIVVITIFGSNFSMLCGFQYIPSTAAEDGYFFKIFAHRSEKHGGLADVSLSVVTVITAIFCFFEFEIVVDAMTTMLVLVQFMGQCVGLMYYKASTPKDQLPSSGFKIPLYPFPCIVQLLLFLFIFITTDNYLVSGGAPVLELSIAFLLFGAGLFLVRSKMRKEWPFFQHQDNSADDAAAVADDDADADNSSTCNEEVVVVTRKREEEEATTEELGRLEEPAEEGR